MVKLVESIAVGIAVILLGGCETHQEFVKVMDLLVGRNADDREPFQYGYLGNAEEIRELSNKNLEYVLNYSTKNNPKKCKVAVEVDKVSRRFVSWRYVSEASYCFHVP